MNIQKIVNNLIIFVKHYYYLFLIQPYYQNELSLQKDNLESQKHKLEESMHQLSIKNNLFEEKNISFKYEIEKLETKVTNLVKENQLLNFKINYQKPPKTNESIDKKWIRNSPSPSPGFIQRNVRKSQVEGSNHDKKIYEDKIKELQTKNEELQTKLKKYEKLFADKSTKKSKKVISLAGINNKKYGSGPIRYKENNKYYHGVGKNEAQKWNWKNKYNHNFFEYKMDHHLPNSETWDTYNARDFCSNCVIDEKLSKNRRIMKIYKCNGHEI